jgi:hypothetical protein
MTWSHGEHAEEPSLEATEHRGSHHAARGARGATSGGKSIAMATPAGAQRCGNSRSLSPSGKAIRSDPMLNS